MARRKKQARKSSMWSFPGQIVRQVGQFIIVHGGMLLLTSALVVGFFGLKQYCYSSPAFFVSVIEISPTKFIARDQVLRIAELEYGMNIFNVDLRQAARRLEALPRIKRAEVMRVLPDSVHIDITERKEYAQIRLPFRKKYYLIDREGYVLTPVLKTARSELVIIDARFSKRSSLAPGDLFYNSIVEKAFKLIARSKFDALLSNEKIASIMVDHADSMTIILDDGLQIKIGSDIDGDLAKLGKAQEILQGETRKSIKYIDMRFKDIVVKQK